MKKTIVERKAGSGLGKKVFNDKTYLVEVGKNIREMRKRRGISQGELSRLTGMKVPNISVIERGKSNPQLLTLIRMIGAMGCSLEEVIPNCPDLSFIINTPRVYMPRKHMRKS